MITVRTIPAQEHLDFLRTRDSASFLQTPAWAQAIANPKSRLDKLGVKPGQRIGVLNVADDALAPELAARDAAPVSDPHELDILFYGADTPAELDRIPALIPALAAGGALWIVSRKGKAATIKDVEVMAAAKAHGAPF